MLSIRNGTLHYVVGAFLSENIDTTVQCLLELGIEAKNSKGEFKPFNEVMEQIYSLHVHEDDVKEQKCGRWVYWDGWRGNHDLRIEDATCSECGYEHPTVRWVQGDPRGGAAYEAVLNKLSGECPRCGALMQKE